MKILTLNYEYPPLGGGGGRLCRMVAEGLAARGHEVRVVTTGMAHLPREEVAGGVKILRPKSWRKAEDTCRVHEMAGYLVTSYPETVRQMDQWKPDVIHSHFVVPTGVLGAVVSHLFRCPHVVTAHLGDVPGGVPEQTSELFRLAAPVARAIWRGAKGRTAVSTFVAELASKAFAEPAEVILNGIPAVLDVPAWQRSGSPRLLMVGRLSVQKNPVMAIEALALLQDLEWELEVIGLGPLEGEMRDAVSALGLDSRVRFLGWLEEAAVKARMKEADLLVMPSLHEGLPMAAVEALWHGLAIVGTRIGGLQDVVVTGENGGLVEIYAEAFAAELRHWLSDRERLIAARQASWQLARRFDFQKSVEAYETVLTRAAVAR